jgi:hypothetical protein
MWILDSYLVFISQLYTNSIVVGQEQGDVSLNENVLSNDRDELEAKMAKALSGEMKDLSSDLQRILIDDMVTAFENRLNVLNRAKLRSGFQ